MRQREKNRVPRSVLLEGVSASAAGRLDEFKPQELSTLAWALAKAGHDAPRLFDGIAEAALGRLDEFGAQAIVSTVWAFAKAKHSAPQVRPRACSIYRRAVFIGTRYLYAHDIYRRVVFIGARYS